MSTPNFSLRNANGYYVIGQPVYYTQEYVKKCGLDENLVGEFDEDGTQIAFDIALADCQCLLEARGWEKDDERIYGDRYYPSKSIAEKSVEFEFCGVWHRITVNAIVRSGYYSGSNLDWIAKLDIATRETSYWSEQYSYDLEVDYYPTDYIVSDNWCGNIGLSKIHAKRLIGRIDAELKKITGECEQVFALCCDEKLVRVCVFSNGEALYERASA